MPTFRKLSFLSFVFAFIASGFCQNQPQLKVAPVPASSFELVNGTTQVAATPQERERALGLAERARQNSDIRTPGSAPYVLKVSFTSNGSPQFNGSGEMEETWLAPYNFRWNVRLGAFEFSRTVARGLTSDDKAVDFLPMRLQMLRGALLWPMYVAPKALIRTAASQWQGNEVNCILTSGPMGDATATPGRRWEEREFCVDSKTGTLQIMSEAPGIYVVYDYTNSLQFHGRKLARKVSIIQGSNTVLEAHIDSITDADANNPDLLNASAEMQNHAGPILADIMRFPLFVHLPAGSSSVQPVIVHAILDPKGKVMDAELLEKESANTEFGQSALDLVRNGNYAAAQRGRQQREAYINVRFVSE